ncbi:DUF1648 domain-containing protein [Halpernia sp. GG3]
MKDILNFLDGFNYALLGILWIYSVLQFKKLPKIIPVHYDLNGNPDSFGNKIWFFILPTVAILIFALISYTQKDISTVNFPFKITESNKGNQIFIMQLFLKLLPIIVLILFLNIQKNTFKYSTENDYQGKFSNSKFLISIFALIVMAVFAAYIYR